MDREREHSGAAPTASIVPQLLTVQEVAAVLRVSRSEVYALKDRIGYVVVGNRRIRFEPDAVLAYVQAQRRRREPAPASTRRSAPGGAPRSPTKVATNAGPRAAAIEERLRRGAPAKERTDAR